ncbi:MAG: aminotransferase class IV [Rhodospirillaceae bacterium]|jgi:branched-chain amino acid aminotransferase|nr:aminotransferase class IV [Rhodospirillaceae bacterium]MBT3492965.1 aminotransferase class IV [Rhodospirillaceae bacterium]MBT3780478.1 aminotransferase class IV [Rhodospirillaceae bacterium]MBT3977262.1 aminotransferase class IV [Rhodospirillaceae bacterium]MBT4167534.1 aminotransferase class IV [Rhodospirillaceae bacterium]
MAGGSHDYLDDQRNASILISINGELFSRDDAKVSVFDSGFMLGDGVWEGIRLHKGRLLFLEAHMERLYEGAKAIDMDIGLSPEQMVTRIDEVLAGNSMDTDVHIRLMVTRGIKSTPYQHPKVTITPPTVVIIPEYKVAVEGPGLKLATVHVRRGAPDVQDPALNTHSKLNCITACIQADKMGADEALMLDPHGFVATCNSTHFFIVRKGEVWTSSGRYCLAGITRANILQLARGNAIPALEKDFSLKDVYNADEAFVTGTFAGLIPVHEIDGRVIGSDTGPVTARLQALYRDLCEREAGA